MPCSVLIESSSLLWLDLTGGSREELIELAEKWNLPKPILADCLDPSHLPKFEPGAGFNFLVLRGFDEKAEPDADTIQELTRKVALFIRAGSAEEPTLVISVHRVDQPYLKRWKERTAASALDPAHATVGFLISSLIESVLQSYRAPLTQSTDELETLEMSAFEVKGVRSFEMKQGYLLKRRSFVFRRMIQTTTDLVRELSDESPQRRQEFRRAKEEARSAQTLADHLHEGVTGLLNLYLGLAAHRTNEIMRVLTVFSVFLLPVNVITGIYGMNFTAIPGLSHPLGFWFALLSMVVVSGSVFYWVKNKNWSG